MKNRVIAPLLALMMLLSLVPVTAMGAADTAMHAIAEEQGSYINPLWAEGETALEDIPLLDAPDAEEDPEYLTSEADVISQIRANYKNRVEAFDIYYKTTDTLHIEDLEALADAALEHTGVPTEGDYLRWSRQFASYSLGGQTDGRTNYYCFAFQVGYHASAGHEALVDEAIAKLHAELALDQLSGYRSLKAIYDWLCDNVTYDYGEDPSTYPLRHSAYGAVVSKHCVCQGYALTVYRMLLEEGIDCRLISGDSDGDGKTDHGWNIAKLEGKYYNLDATWDAGSYRISHFLVSPDNFPDHDRDPEFDTPEFHAAYPMANADYVFTPDIVEEGPSGSNLYWTLDDEGILTISGSGEMTMSTWRSQLADIRYVVMEDGITSICDDAFSYLYNMAGISIPGSVKTIGDNAFEGCAKLKYISIPRGVTEIGTSAFSLCTGLIEAKIPNGVTSIEHYAFNNCPAMENIFFLGDAPSFGDDVFRMDRVTAHYPATNPTWTAGILQNYGGAVTWKANSCLYGHTPVIDPEKPSTCKEAGLSEGQHCSACGEVLIPQEALPLADHTPVVDPYVAATCTEPGYFEGRHCGICSEVLIEQFEIPALGHLWGFWSTVTEATETTAGEESRTCIRCSETESREIPATGSADTPTEPPLEDEPEKEPEVVFTDVPAVAYYAEPVNWAVSQGITNGTSATTFSPEATCIRGQIVTFLWRAEGCPEPAVVQNPFTDVFPGDYFYKAVLWAVEKGITAGTSTTTFSPNDPCTRGQVATFLWRAQGQQLPAGESVPFLDVIPGAYYYTAVRWAVEQGITTGTTSVTFSPDLPCTRGQIVTFLHRSIV